MSLAPPTEIVLPLRRGNARDRRLRHQRIGRRPGFEAHDRDRRASCDRANRIDEAGRHRDIKRTRRELLDHGGARLHVDEIDLDVLRREQALVDADEDRPQVRRGRADRADRHRVRGVRGAQRAAHASMPESRTARASRCVRLPSCPPLARRDRAGNQDLRPAAGRSTSLNEPECHPPRRRPR